MNNECYFEIIGKGDGPFAIPLLFFFCPVLPKRVVSAALLPYPLRMTKGEIIPFNNTSVSRFAPLRR